MLGMGGPFVAVTTLMSCGTEERPRLASAIRVPPCRHGQDPSHTEAKLFHAHGYLSGYLDRDEYCESAISIQARCDGIAAAAKPHLRGVSPQELVDANFTESGDFPGSDIYLRLFQEANGDLIQVMRCDIAADALGSLIRREPGVRRPSALAPPPWWPWDRQRAEGAPVSAFRVPDWFEPQGDSAFFTERRVPR